MELTKKSADEDTSGRYWSRSEKNLWVGTLFFGCAVVYAARTSMPLCALTMASEFNWNKKESGSILSSFFWGYTMTQVAGGYLSDRIGGDRVMTASAVAWSLLTFWTPFIVYVYPDKSSLLGFIVFTRVIMGCIQGVHYPAISSILGKYIPKSDRAFCFATACSGGHLGTLISGSLGSVLLARFGWPVVFYMTGCLGMAWVLFLRYYLIAKQKKKTLILSLNDPSSADSSYAEPVPWMLLFKRMAFWAMVIAHFCHTWSFHLLISWLPTYFGENYPGAKGWVFNVVPWSVTIFSSIFGGWVADKLVEKGFNATFVRKFSCTISVGGVGFFLILVGYSETYQASLILMALAIACGGFHGGGILVNPQDLAPKYSGSVFGIMNMAGAIPGFMAVYIAGYQLEVTKSWSLVFNQTAGVCFFGWILYLMFGTAKKIV